MSVLSRRFPLRGNSFSSVLLTVVIVFGAIGFYYFNYLRFGALEEPMDGLVIVERVEGAQLNSFRKMAVARVCDPTGQQIKRLNEIRELTKGGEVQYEDFEQDCTEVKNRLIEIMDDARLRRIPKRFKKHYAEALMSIHFAYRSLLSLEDSVEAATPQERKKLLNEARRFAKKAKKARAVSREYFMGKDWSE